MDAKEQAIETTREVQAVAERRAERAGQAAKGVGSQADALKIGAEIANEEMTAAQAEVEQAQASVQEVRERAKAQ